MAYNVQITGHEDFEKVSDEADFERELAEKVGKFAAGIPGVRLAFVSGDRIGHREVVRNDAPAPELEEPEEKPKSKRGGRKS